MFDTVRSERPPTPTEVDHEIVGPPVPVAGPGRLLVQHARVRAGAVEHRLRQPGRTEAAQHDDYDRPGRHVRHRSRPPARPTRSQTCRRSAGSRASIAPTSDSQILFEVWLPLEKWNGKFAGVGNGGWAGLISFPQLADQLRRGYAAASTNTGHEAASGTNAARFAFEKPEQLIDFAYRSHHETALKAKAITEAFYAKPPERSYFIGCSSGGYEGLMEAQRFPDDYDGIVAGMPANNWTRLMAGDFDATLAVFKGGVNNLPTTALGLLHRSALAACDSKDGVVDGVLDDPRQCAFDPGRLVLQVRPSGGQLPLGRAGRRGQTRVRRPQGSDDRHATLSGSRAGQRAVLAESRCRESIPDTDRALQVARVCRSELGLDVVRVQRPRGLSGAPEGRGEVCADPQRDRSEPQSVPAARRQAAAVSRLERPADHAAQQHQLLRERAVVLWRWQSGRERKRCKTCRASTGCSWLRAWRTAAAERARTRSTCRWRSSNGWSVASRRSRIVATRGINGVVDRLRPLCAYPQVAVYKGQGDTNEAANFECRVPPPSRYADSP